MAFLLQPAGGNAFSCYRATADGRSWPTGLHKAGRLVWDRYVQRLGGLNVYVRNERVRERERVTAEIRSSFDGRNTKELARKHHLSLRQVQRILQDTTNA